jgi:hypothetical protein
MNIKIKVAAVLVGLVSASVLANSALAGESSSASGGADAMGLTSNTASYWAGPSEKAAPAAEVASMQRMAESLGGDAINALTSRRVDVTPSRHVSIAPSRNGAICWYADDSTQPYDTGSGCGHGVPYTGLVVTYTTTDGYPPTLMGWVARDVTGLTLTLADGSSRSVDVSNGVVYWAGAVGDEVVAATSVRGGETHTERKLFEPADFS